MAEQNQRNRSRAIHYFPIIAVMVFWLGAGLVSSLMVDTPYITCLGLVTLPLVVCALVAVLKVKRELDRED